MKKVLKITLLSLLSIILFTGSAMAGSFTTMDFVGSGPGAAWPGYYNPAFPNDEIGVPKIESLTVNTNGSGDLTSVVVQMRTSELVLWDSLFINTELDGAQGYEGWDYYVKSDTPWAGKLYDVTSGYAYTMGTIRLGQPAGLVIDNVTVTEHAGLLQSVSWNSSTFERTFTFNPGINVGTSFAVGYSQYCANDVILTQVPEPGTLLLLGLGLLGIGISSRKRLS
jgi:hypothetical protein